MAKPATWTIEHTPEPWAWDSTAPHILCAPGKGPTGGRIDEKTVILMLSKNARLRMKEANADRIVACVNACAGVSNYQLTLGGVRALLQDHAHLLRKIAHGCTDMNCAPCDREADARSPDTEGHA